MPTTTDDERSFHFPGFSAPNGTFVPNEVFDTLLPILGAAEIRALFYIVRRTFGFRKERDAISFNQFLRGIVRRSGRVLDHGCGIKNRTNLSRALRSLEALGAIESDKGWDERGENQTTVYRLRFRNDVGEGVVPKKHYPSAEEVPPVVPLQYPQKIVEQQKDLQSNSSTIEARNDIEAERTASHPIADDQSRQVSSEVVPIAQLMHQRVGQLRQRSPAPSASHRRKNIPVGPSAPSATAYRADSGREVVVPPDEAHEGSGVAAVDPDGRARPPLQIEAIITQFSNEFHDDEHLEANINQAARLWKQSGRSEQTFSQLLFDSASTTRKRGGVRNRMAYYFRVLRDMLGLTKPPE